MGLYTVVFAYLGPGNDAPDDLGRGRGGGHPDDVRPEFLALGPGDRSARRRPAKPSRQPRRIGTGPVGGMVPEPGAGPGLIGLDWSSIGDRKSHGPPGHPSTVPGRLSREGFRIKRVIVIGLDGLEPAIVEPMLAAGELPNLARLRGRGGFATVATTSPAQTPVAWSTFATGTNPGGHGIFDFLRRDPADLPARPRPEPLRAEERVPAARRR